MLPTHQRFAMFLIAKFIFFRSGARPATPFRNAIAIALDYARSRYSLKWEPMCWRLSICSDPSREQTSFCRKG